MDYPFFILNCNDKREKVIIKSSVSQKDTKDDIQYYTCTEMEITKNKNPTARL